MLTQHGGRAHAALCPKGGSLHLLDWPTSIILADVSPALCPPPRSCCGTPFPSGIPCIPPAPRSKARPPTPHRQRSSRGAPALPTGTGAPRPPRGGLAERLETPPPQF